MENSNKYIDENKLSVLKFLLEENNKELIFWRERNWSALKVSIGSYIALAGISFFKKNTNSLVFLVIGIAILSTIYLYKNYKRYQEKRNIGSRIEKALSLFQNDVFISNEPLFPIELEKPKTSKLGSYSFISAVWIVAIATTLAILFA